jgi:hypothetical protein
LRSKQGAAVAKALALLAEALAKEMRTKEEITQ